LLPLAAGNVAGHLVWSSPSRIFASPGLIDTALTFTSAVPPAGPGPADVIAFELELWHQNTPHLSD
jgi:hypothetical protein